MKRFLHILENIMGSFAGPKKINKIFSITKMIPFILFFGIFLFSPGVGRRKKEASEPSA